MNAGSSTCLGLRSQRLLCSYRLCTVTCVGICDLTYHCQAKAWEWQPGRPDPCLIICASLAVV